MFNYFTTTKKLDEKGIVDAKILFTMSTLANFAKTAVGSEGMAIIEDKTCDKYQVILQELDKIIDTSLQLMNSLDDEDRGLCKVNDVNDFILDNCDELSPDLLAFYIAMNAFTDNKDEVFDERLQSLTSIKTGICSGHTIDVLNIEAGCNLDASMWNLSTSIIKLIKGN